MSRTILFLAGPQDLADLESFAIGSGLDVLPFNLATGAQSRSRWLSPVPTADLRLQDGVPLEVWNPVLQYDRGGVEGPYFVIGRITLDEAVTDIARVARPHFDRIGRWIRKRWPRSAEAWSLYVGPQATELLGSGLEIVNWAPGTVTGETVELATGRRTPVDLTKPDWLERFFGRRGR